MFGSYLRILPIFFMLTACSFKGQDIGDPITRNLRWFAYVGAEDLRSACTDGAPDQYRLVYNAVYDTQIRSYDFDSARKILIAHVRGADSGNLLGATLSDPLNPWQATEARTPLTDELYDKIIAALQHDGAFGPSPKGLRLPSHGYYWTAAACHKGRFSFGAWAYPDPTFSALTFDKLVIGNDNTNIAAAPAKPLGFDSAWEENRRIGRTVDFTLEVGTDGLIR